MRALLSILVQPLVSAIIGGRVAPLGGGGVVPANAVLLNGSPVVINGEYVTLTP